MGAIVGSFVLKLPLSDSDPSKYPSCTMLISNFNKLIDRLSWTLPAVNVLFNVCGCLGSIP